jgi:hypothetical protein
MSLSEFNFLIHTIYRCALTKKAEQMKKNSCPIGR